MLASFVPTSIDFNAAINSTGPLPEALDLANPIGLPLTVVEGEVLFDAAPSSTIVNSVAEPAGTFNVRDIIVFDVELVPIHDPDAPHAKGKQKSLVFAGSRSGPGSIAVAAGQIALIRLSYQAGPTPVKEAGRLVVSTTESDTATIPLSLTTFVPPTASVVETALSANQFSIVVGKTAQLTISVRSVSGPGTDVSFEKSAIFLDAKVSMQSVNVHVEPGQTNTAALIFQADPDATTGTFDFAVQQFTPNRLPFIDLRVTILPAPVSDPLEIAREMIQAKYEQVGGRLSPLGRPVHSDAPVLSEGNQFFTDYRGGRISVLDGAEGASAEVTSKLIVRYRGIHCFGKSEAVDEPYAIVGVYTPDSPETTVTKKFPIDAPSYENFVASTDKSELIDIRTFDDVPQDIAISCTVMEHDSGDPDRAAAAVEDALKKAASDSGAVDAADISVFTGLLDDLKIPGLIADLLGVGDDVIGSQTLPIHYTQLQPAAPPMQKFGNVSFNFESPLLSDGDASYKIYFEVFIETIDPPKRL